MNYIALEAFDWTNLATLEFVTHILQTTDSKKITIGFFWDVEKAFDRVNYEILLLGQLECYGIRRLALD